MEKILRLPDLDELIARRCGAGYPENVNGTRVLIVDDNKDAASSLARLLGTMGKQTHVVYDGRSALAALAEFRPDVVLLDLGMPGMDGFETARHMRAHPDGASCVFIALTGWGESEDRRRTAEAGFAAHLVKPVKVDMLESVVKSLVEAPPVAPPGDGHATDPG